MDCLKQDNDINQKDSLDDQTGFINYNNIINFEVTSDWRAWNNKDNYIDNIRILSGNNENGKYYKEDTQAYEKLQNQDLKQNPYAILQYVKDMIDINYVNNYQDKSQKMSVYSNNVPYRNLILLVTIFKRIYDSIEQFEKTVNNGPKNSP